MPCERDLLRVRRRRRADQLLNFLILPLHGLQLTLQRGRLLMDAFERALLRAGLLGERCGALPSRRNLHAGEGQRPDQDEQGAGNPGDELTRADDETVDGFAPLRDDLDEIAFF